MAVEPVRRVWHTQVFLKMAALELRRIAERTPDVAAELCHIAQKLEAEVEDLVRDTASTPNLGFGPQS
jgi:type II secretory pathway component PulF